MTTLHSKQPGLPAYKYAQHVDAVTRPLYVQRIFRGNRKPAPDQLTWPRLLLLVAGSLLMGAAYYYAV